VPVDVGAAERFVFANARVLERHRLAVLLSGGEVAPVLEALRAYRNPDGGFGHALEPDVRAPESEPASTLSALEVLAEVGALDDPMVEGAWAWIGTIADRDGGMPFVLPSAAAHPHAPWMVPSDGGSFLTFAIAARLWEAGSSEPWLDRATDWCWSKLESSDELSAYWLKFSLDFLDHVPDQARASATIERLRSQLGRDGSITSLAAPRTSVSPRWLCHRGLTAAAGRCSPTTRSTSTSTYSSVVNRSTVAGRSIGSRGRRVNPLNGVAS